MKIATFKIHKFVTVLEISRKEAKAGAGGSGYWRQWVRDLAKSERTTVGLKTKDFWSKDKSQVQHGATVKVTYECAASGVLAVQGPPRVLHKT